MRSRPWANGIALSVLALPVVLAVPVAGSSPAPRPVAPDHDTVALPLPDAGFGVRSGAAPSEVHLPARRTERFSVLGVTWRPAAQRPDLEVQVRTRSVDGGWSAWRDLHGQTDDAPDGGSADTARTSLRTGTSPSWVGPSDGVEVRVEVARGPVPADLRVDLVDPGTSPADGRQTGPRDAATASEPRPTVVTRAQWGADESLRTCTPSYTGTPRVAFVHHTASSNDYTPAEAAAAVRGFYAYHVKSNGWCDLGYNYLVDRYGVVYEGRYGGIEAAVLGAHTGGFNANSFGTAMIGDFSRATPPAAMRASLRRLLAWRLGRAYADPAGAAQLRAAGSGSRFPAGTTVTFDVISGHRDAVRTTCPGDVGYGILEQLRADVRAEMGSGLVGPTATPTALPRDGGPVAVSAGLLVPARWRLEVTSASSGRVVRTLSGTGDRVRTGWDLRDAAGARVDAGLYRLALSGGPASDPLAPWAGTVRVQAVGTPAPRPAPPASLSGRGAGYVALPPTRVLDTRRGTGGRSTPLGAGDVLDLRLAGVARVPADATAVVLNLTGTGPSSGTHLTVWPTGGVRPGTSVLNLRPGRTSASLVLAGLGRGSVSVRNLAGRVDLVADVVGYYAATGGDLFHPVAPARLLDTRSPRGGGRVGDGRTRSLLVRGRGGVPGTARAAVLNVTAVGPSSSGYVAATPAGAARGTSSVNYAAGETVANRVVTGLSADGRIDLAVEGSTHLLVDVVGWYAPSSVSGGSRLHPLRPARLVDSRTGRGTPSVPFGARVTRDVQVTGAAGIPAGASAVVVTLTGTGVSASQTHLSAYADGIARPGTSDVNLVRGDTRANLAVVPLSASGRMSLYNAAGRTEVVADVLGYYSR